MDTFTLLKDLTRFAMAAAMRWFPVAPVTSAHHATRTARVRPVTRSSIGLREHVALLLDRRGEA